LSRWRLLQAFWINVKRLLYAGNHDFCPGVNKYVYWLKRPIGWLLTAALASILVGVSVGVQGWIVLSVVLVVIVLGVFWPALQMRACRGTLLVQQPRGIEGQPLRITLQITNYLPIPLWGLMISQKFLESTSEDGIADTPSENGGVNAGSTQDDTMAALAKVPGWSVTEFHWDHAPKQRGRFPRSGAMLATGFPFGIWQSTRWLQFESSCLIWPHVPQLEDELIVGHLRAMGEQSYESRAGQEGDFLGLRRYREGDPLRTIHWPQSARTGHLIVRELEKSVSRHLTVMIDVSDLLQAKSRSEGLEWRQIRDQRAEQRLRIGLSIVEALWAVGFDVKLQLGHQVWETQSERRSVQALMDCIAEWSWPSFFERYHTRRTINLRPDFLIADWRGWQQGSDVNLLSEPSQACILVNDRFDSQNPTLRLVESASGRSGIPCWQTGVAP
jgi:uncharacterized protein (DUF58 family)